MTAPTATPPATPAAGDPLYLDGYWYVLGAPEVTRHSPAPLLTFYRPDEWARRQEVAALQGLKEADREAHGHRVTALGQAFGSVDAYLASQIQPDWRANFNYKRDGLMLDAPRWLDRAGLVDAIEAQADLALSVPRRRAWVRAARRVQRDALPADLVGAWVLEGRALLKPTCVRGTHPDPAVQRQLDLNPVIVEPQADAEALALAAAVLTSAPDVFARVTALASWAPPAGVTLHPWEG